MELITPEGAVEWVIRDDAPDTSLKDAILEQLCGGATLSDELVARAIARYTGRAECALHGWVLDGFPMTESQAKALDAVGVVPRTVLLLTAPEQDLRARMQAAVAGEQSRIDLGLGPAVLGKGLAKVKKAKKGGGGGDDGDGDGEAEGGDGGDGADGGDGGDGEEGGAGAAPKAVVVEPGQYAAVTAMQERGALASNVTLTAARSDLTGGYKPVEIAKRVLGQVAECSRVVDTYLAKYENVKSVDASAEQSRWAIADAIMGQSGPSSWWWLSH